MQNGKVVPRIVGTKTSSRLFLHLYPYTTRKLSYSDKNLVAIFKIVIIGSSTVTGMKVVTKSNYFVIIRDDVTKFESLVIIFSTCHNENVTKCLAGNKTNN